MRGLPCLAAGIVFGAALLAGAPADADQSIVCESRDNRYEECRIDTRGGVSLDQQLSKSPCRYNDSWGYNRRGVWVSEGCRARFIVRDPGWHDSSSGGWGSQDGSAVRCESRDNRRQYCDANTRDGVRLSRQLSRSACDYGATWGYDRRGIWVDHGCRADFELRRRGWGSPGASNPQGRVVQCESRDNRRQYCRANTRGGVRLDEQLSRSPCRRGSWWGYDSGGVWVRDGCRARFSLGRGYAGGDRSYDSYSSDGGSDGAAAVAGAAVLVGALAAISSSSQHHDEETLAACQREIERRIRKDQPGVSYVDFGNGTAEKDGHYREVHGDGRAEVGGRRDGFRFECRVRTKSNEVVAADYDW